MANSRQKSLHWVRTRVSRESGVDMLETLIVGASAHRADLTWAELQTASIDRALTTLRPPGREESRAERVASVLDELGWTPVAAGNREDGFTARRSAIQFRGHGGLHTPDGARLIAVLTMDTGERIAGYPVGDLSDEATFERHGWQPVDRMDGWSDRPWRLVARDWPRILTEAAEQRRIAREVAASADDALRRLIRESLHDGVDSPTIADLVGMTRQRVYQIRDGRR